MKDTIRRPAQKLFKYLRTKPLPVNAREILALERTKLANERTFLAYVRASLYLLLGGLALLGLEDFRSIRWLGYIALFACVVFLAVGIVRYISLTRRLRKWNRILFTDIHPEDPIKKDKESD
ncbi:DUF202 domain-containing protein [Flavobacteriaceae bacterium TK19130]|nr:DUF202 domain-containing protein [Thermobacterium salinum]